MGFMGIPSKEDINSVIHDAPGNLVLGIEKAIAMPKEKIDGLVTAGKNVWGSFTPEQQEQLKSAFVQLVVAGATIAAKSQKK